MSVFVKPAVCVLLTLLCVWLVRSFDGYVKRRRVESRELLFICEVIRKSISTSLSTPREALGRTDELSSSAEQLRLAVVSGATLSEAFSAVSHSMSLSGESARMLSEYFRAFGKGYRADELLCADEFIERYRKQIELEEAADDAELKVTKSVIVAVTLGLIIFIA